MFRGLKCLCRFFNMDSRKKSVKRTEGIGQHQWRNEGKEHLACSNDHNGNDHEHFRLYVVGPNHRNRRSAFGEEVLRRDLRLVQNRLIRRRVHRLNELTSTG